MTLQHEDLLKINILTISCRLILRAGCRSCSSFACHNGFQLSMRRGELSLQIEGKFEIRLPRSSLSGSSCLAHLILGTVSTYFVRREPFKWIPLDSVEYIWTTTSCGGLDVGLIWGFNIMRNVHAPGSRRLLTDHAGEGLTRINHVKSRWWMSILRLKPSCCLHGCKTVKLFQERQCPWANSVDKPPAQCGKITVLRWKPLSFAACWVGKEYKRRGHTRVKKK